MLSWNHRLGETPDIKHAINYIRIMNVMNKKVQGRDWE
jgi:hypothetical protein